MKPYRPEANLPAAGHRDPLASKKNFMYTVVSDGSIRLSIKLRDTHWVKPFKIARRYDTTFLSHTG